MVEFAVGGVAEVKRFAPSAVVAVKSVRTAFAKRTAPSLLSCPVPCSKLFTPLIGCAVNIKAILTMFGVSFEFA